MSDKGYQAEQRALGALFLADDPRTLVLRYGVTGDLFADEGHRLTFAAVLRAADQDEFGKVRVEEVVDDLARAGHAETCGGLEYVSALPGGVLTARNFGLDVERMRDARLRVSTSSALTRAAEQVLSGAELAPVIDSTMADLQAARVGAGDAAGRALFTVVPVADLAEAEPPAPGFWWADYLPERVVTMLGAHGGTGKSTLALMLAVCIALGLVLFGVPTRCGIVAYFSGEDPGDLIRHRLRRICRHLGVEPAALDGRLHVLDATAFDPVLFHEVTAGARRIGTTTPTYSDLRAFAAANSVDVLIVDNASDTFDASEIDRAKVRAFMRALASIAQDRGGAVLLLAHVDKGTSRGERSGSEGYSGSTAWHNSARSRLYLSRDRDGALLLEHQKSNLGRLREPVTLEWPHDGLPQLVAQMNPVVQHIADRNDTKTVLALIHEFNGRTDYINTAITGRANAAAVLAREPSYPRLKPADLFDLLRRAGRAGHLVRVDYKTADRKPRQRWEVTPEGVRFAGLAPNAQNAPNGRDSAIGAFGAESAPNAPNSAWGVRGDSARTEFGAEAAQ